MYRTWVPIHGRTLSHENREIYLGQLKAADCESIVIVAFEMEREGAYETLSDHIAFFSQNGVEAGIWVGSTLGHGSGPLLENTDPGRHPPLVSLDGTPQAGTRCPLSPEFRRDFSHYCARLATTGAKTILLDDDFRLSRRAGGGIYCACDLHLAEIGRILGRPVTREELRDKAFTGERNEYRDAFLKASGDSLRLLAREIRSAVDAVDPSVRVALCGAHSLWDLDGVDGLELAHILAGKNPPLLRLHGAPYWPVVSSSKDLTATLEIARMFASFSDDGETTLLAEGDVFPRPRYNVPASYLELFDAAMRADGGHHGILKYMVDYNASATHETGYLRHHMHDLPRLRAVTEQFCGTFPLGVRVHIAPHRLGNADLSLDAPSDQSPYPAAGAMLQSAGIPTVYRGDGFTDAVFGEEGRYFDVSTARNGLLLDAVSAILLTRRGTDVGLTGEGTFSEGSVSAAVTHEPQEHNTLLGARARILRADLSDGARVLVYARTGDGDLPLLYRYENADGQRFLVTLVSGLYSLRSSAIYKSYLFGEALKTGIEWLTRRPLPVRLPPDPGLYTVAGERDGARTLLLLNTYPDAVLDPRITLDAPVRSVECVGCTGHADGNTVLFDAPLPAFSFALLKIYL